MTKPVNITVLPEAVGPLKQATQAAYEGVREVRIRAIEAGCSNAESNRLGGIMFALGKVIDQLP